MSFVATTTTSGISIDIHCSGLVELRAERHECFIDAHYAAEPARMPIQPAAKQTVSVKNAYVIASTLEFF